MLGKIKVCYLKKIQRRRRRKQRVHVPPHFQNKGRGGGAHVVCAPTFGQNKCSNFAKYLLIFCSFKCKIVNQKKKQNKTKQKTKLAHFARQVYNIIFFQV